MAVTGKTGGDAIYKAIKRILIVESHYGAKLDAVMTIMVSLGLLDAADAAVVRLFLGQLPALLAALAKIADYSGF